MDMSALSSALPSAPQSSGRTITFASENFGPPEILVNELHYHSKIGQGCFGNVYRGECRGKEVAIKKLYRQDLSEKALTDFKREVEICSRIHHPNVLLFMGACMELGELAIVTEIMPKGNLEQLLHDPSRSFSLVVRMRMAKDVAQGMNWLHCSNPVIMHRDLKPSNLLVDDNGRIKVCDFGLSCVKEKGEKLRDKDSTPGTPLWMSPEVLMGRPVDEKSDVYSYAIVLWEIATLDIPFPDATAHTFRRQICIENKRPPLTKLSHLPSLCDLIQRCWDKNPNLRPGFDEIIKALNIIIIDAAIQDEAGRQFWKTEFLAKDDEVLWDRFYVALCNQLQISPHELSIIKQDILKAMFARRSSDSTLREPPFVVDIDTFEQVLSHFGPFLSNTTETIIDRMYAAASCDWYHGSITTDVAVGLLQKQPIGTFLVRDSTTVRGSFTISKVNRAGDLTHQRIDFSNGVLSLRRGTETFSDASLPTLIAKASASLALLLPCPGSRFARIIHGASANPDKYLTPEEIDDSL